MLALALEPAPASSASEMPHNTSPGGEEASQGLIKNEARLPEFLPCARHWAAETFGADIVFAPPAGEESEGWKCSETQLSPQAGP